MHKIVYSILPAALLALCLVADARAQDVVAQPPTDKIAQTGFKFLSVSMDPRAAALADAVTADSRQGAMAMLYNPAALSAMTSTFSAAAGQTQYIADINYNAAAIAFAPAGGAYGVFGFSFTAADYGEVIGTIRSDTPSGFQRYSELGLANPTPTALAAGFGYAKALTDRFAVGGHLKYVNQNFDQGVLRPDATAAGSYEMNDNSLSTMAFDFGLLYKTGYKSLNFAMTARNFAQEVKYFEENFELPLVFRMGISMDLMDFTGLDRKMHSLRVGLDADRPRDFDENLRLGGEYTFMNTLSLRAGYGYPTDEQGVSLGAGLHSSLGGFGIGADYAYTNFGIFGSVSRIALQVGF